jgi:hypothetical protein
MQLKNMNRLIPETRQAIAAQAQQHRTAMHWGARHTAT